MPIMVIILVISIRGEQRSKGGSSASGGQQQIALRGQGHFIDPCRSPGGNRLLQRSERRRIEIKDFQGAVPIAHIEPPAM